MTLAARSRAGGRVPPIGLRWDDGYVGIPLSYTIATGVDYGFKAPVLASRAVSRLE